jgi:hypothetical protein
MTAARAIVADVGKRHHGIWVRHRAGCPTLAAPGARCRCKPAYLASVWLADPSAAAGTERIEADG